MSEPQPFLPEHSPDPPPANKIRAKRILLLWALLVLAFYAIWQFLSPDASSTGAGRSVSVTAPACEYKSADLVLLLLPTLLFIVFLAIFVRGYGQVARFNVSQEAGLVALAERSFEAAVSLLSVTRSRYTHKPVYRGVVDLNVSHAQLWAGRLDEAIATLVLADRSAGLPKSSGVRTLAAVELAITYALVGDTKAAELWVRETRARTAKTGEERMAFATRICMTEALIDCRCGAFAQAAARLEERWLVLRHTLNANLMRVVEVICAFAKAQASDCEQDATRARLQRIEPVVRNEFRFLGERWPEMQAFLVAHGLSET